MTTVTQPVQGQTPASIVTPQRRPSSFWRCLLWTTVLLPFAISTPADDLSGSTTVFRCGASYSDLPCPEGKALALDDSRTDSQRAAAADVAARQAALALRMTTDRERADTSTGTNGRPAKATPLRKTRASSASVPTSNNQPARTSQRYKARRTGDSDDFVAFVPRPPKHVSAKKTL